MIVLRNVWKTRGGREVLRDVSFHIAPLESVGIIGLNGAGKTTLLDTITGMLKPDGGFIRINGQERVLGNTGLCRDLVYISGARPQLWEELKVRASFAHCVEMYRVDRRIAESRLAGLVQAFLIGQFLERTPGSLSLGERMRCELAYAFLAAPPIILLDEVTLGLDVSIRDRVLRYLEEYKRQSRSTLLYTSNRLSEVERLCGRVLMMDAGSIIFDGSVRDMLERVSPLGRMEARVSPAIPDFEDLPLERYCVDGEQITLTYDKRKLDTAQLLRYLMARCEIKDVRLSEPDLEEAVRIIYGGGQGWKQ